jgi:tetrahydromethanopterin S-methyltransferase subunit C
VDRGSWPLVGLTIGGAIGAVWGLLGSGGYESVDSAIGTGLMGAVAGALIGALVAVLANRRWR